MDPEVERLKKKVENYPSPSSYNRLAELLKKNDQIDEAVAICNRSMRDFPRNGQAFVIVAQIQYSVKNTDKAMELLRQAVEADPRCYGAHMLLADIYMDAGHGSYAVRHLEYVLQLRPKDSTAQVKLSQAKGETPRPASDRADIPAATTVQDEQPAAAAAKERETSLIDLSSMSTGLTSIVGRTPESGSAISISSQGSAPTRASSSPDAVLGEYCQQPGVRCAIVADNQGRSLATQNLPPGLDDLVAALAREISEFGSESLEFVSGGGLVSWSITAENGQILSFNENPNLSLIAIAESNMKAAMLELRARQAISDIGGDS